MDKTPTTRKNRTYKKILDKDLTTKQRKITLESLDAPSVAEVANRAEVSEDYVHQAAKDRGLLDMKVGAMMQRDNAMRKILTFCEDILNTEIDTPLKASDKVAAARLYAEISGVLNKGQKDVTVNVGLFDLRNASEAELLAELDRIDAMKRNAIDMTPNGVASVDVE